MLLKFGYHYGEKNVGAPRRAQSTRIYKKTPFPGAQPHVWPYYSFSFHRDREERAGTNEARAP